MATEARNLRGPTPSVRNVRIASASNAATSSVTAGDTIYGHERREANLRLYTEGVQTMHISPQSTARPSQPTAAMEDALRERGVPVDRLKEIARGLVLRRYGDPEEAARTDAEVMEDLEPLRAKANRAELTDWL